MIEVGRIVVKTMGRDAGRFGVVVKVEDDGVIITGPKKLTGVRRRKVNYSHVEPTPYKIDIPEDADDDTVLSALEKAGLIEFMRKRI